MDAWVAFGTGRHRGSLLHALSGLHHAGRDVCAVRQDPPWIIGSCSPAQVAKAVVDAIEHNKLEVLVNSRPLRLFFMLNELAPSLGDWLMWISGSVDFQRRKVGL